MRAVDVSVVLHEVADAEKAVQDAGELVPVQVAGLRQAERQLAVAVRRQRVEEAVAGAVHRLEAEVAAPRSPAGTCAPGTSPSGPRSARARSRRAAACGSRGSRASRSRAGGDPRGRSRSPCPRGCQKGIPGASSEKSNEVEVLGRAACGRGASPPRADGGSPRGPSGRRTPCRRRASAAAWSRRRASRRPRARGASPP